jgi:hypothetical protein
MDSAMKVRLPARSPPAPKAVSVPLAYRYPSSTYTNTATHTSNDTLSKQAHTEERRRPVYTQNATHLILYKKKKEGKVG